MRRCVVRVLWLLNKCKFWFYSDKKYGHSTCRPLSRNFYGMQNDNSTNAKPLKGYGQPPVTSCEWLLTAPVYGIRLHECVTLCVFNRCQPGWVKCGGVILCISLYMTINLILILISISHHQKNNSFNMHLRFPNYLNVLVEVCIANAGYYCMNYGK